MPKVFYLAYGSNLHPLRLQERVPSARVVGVIELSGYQLVFHKQSNDDSGKCLLSKTLDILCKIYVVLYEFDISHKAALDEAEGIGNGYDEELMSVTLDGSDYRAYIYMASITHINSALIPYTWYKNLVIAGARFHNFPVDYIESIESVPSREDLNESRQTKNQNLLERMFTYQ
ncbi:gamma-glutamylcyclotransferase family protein [Methylotenera sp.]|uniref:gamma-glutamylcyclotransferase family protein n=1 Tax=Methylotenera sp. TaxID=2051956 RepID=UPI00248A6EDF|nr:gamma-glutamylcyclotransferase family protein [Methylotenera sp.]MDI1361285.1 gamma-glutamylcyclotransferase [Methylotenera sp.]